MDLSPTAVAGRILPARLFHRVAPALGQIEQALTGADDRARTRQVAVRTFMIRLVGAVLAYGSQVVLARWLGQFDYGIFAVVWTWMLILAAVTALGFQTSVLRFIPEYETGGQFDLLRGLLLSSRAITVAFSVAVAAAGCLGVYLFEDFITDYYVMPIYLIAVCLPFYTLFEVQDGIARSQNWTELSITVNYVWRPLLLLAVLAVIGMAGFPLDATTACYAAIVTSCVITVLQTVGLQLRLPRRVPPGPKRYRTATWVKVSLPIFMVEGFFILLTGSDVVIVSQFLPPEQVAVYFAAVKTMAIIHFVYFAVKAACGHRFSQLYYSGDRQGFADRVRDAVAWTFWPSLAIAAGLLASGHFLLSLFGDDFAAGYPLMGILVVGLLARASVGPVDVLMNMSGHQRICAMVYGSTFVLNIVLNFILIPPFGLTGAAVATTGAMIFETITLAIVVKRRLGLTLFIAAHPGRSRPGGPVEDDPAPEHPS